MSINEILRKYYITSNSLYNKNVIISIQTYISQSYQLLEDVGAFDEETEKIREKEQYQFKESIQQDLDTVNVKTDLL